MARSSAATAAPVLSLWRTPTDNDELGGMAVRWRAWAPDAPARKLVDVRREDGGVTVVAEYATLAGAVRHEHVYLCRGRGADRGDAQFGRPRSTTYRGWARSSRRSPGSMSWSWYGQGPWESYPDRSTGAPVGHHSLPVDELFTPICVRRRAAGGTVYAASRSAPDATGFAVALDEPRQVTVTRYRAADLAAATHHDELVPRPGCVVHLDAAHRGGHGLVRTRHLALPSVPARTHRWSWTLRVL